MIKRRLRKIMSSFMGHREIWWKFTEVSVENTASDIRIGEQVEQGDILSVMEAVHASETSVDLCRNTKLHGVLSQKIFLLMITAVRISDPKYEAEVHGNTIL
jgi:hypothetical protein